MIKIKLTIICILLLLLFILLLLLLLFWFIVQSARCSVRIWDFYPPIECFPRPWDRQKLMSDGVRSIFAGCNLLLFYLLFIQFIMIWNMLPARQVLETSIPLSKFVLPDNPSRPQASGDVSPLSSKCHFLHKKSNLQYIGNYTSVHLHGSLIFLNVE